MKYLAFILMCLSCSATQFYVSQNGSGTFSGTNLANAWSVDLFNADNTGEGKAWRITGINTDGTPYTNTYINNPILVYTNLVSPGDTVNLVGVITNRVIVGGCGVTNQPVTITWYDSSACFSNLSFPNGSSCLFSISKGHLVIDGVATNISRFIASSNGWSYPFTNGIIGINMGDCTDLKIVHVGLGPFDYRPGLLAGTDESEGGNAMYISGVTKDLLITNNFVTDCAGGIVVAWNGLSRNIVISDNSVFHYSEAIKLIFSSAIYPSYIAGDVKILRNTMNISSNYNTSTAGSSGYHQNAIHEYATPVRYWTIINQSSNYLTAVGNPVVEASYDANGTYILTNLSIIPDHWLPGTNDYYLTIGGLNVTNSLYPAGHDSFTSFFPFTNYIVLHGSSNVAITASLYLPYVGGVTNLEIAYNKIGPIGSYQASTDGIFVGDEAGPETWRTFIHDNLMLMDTNTTRQSSGFININGNQALIANNTLVNVSSKAGAPINILNGTGNLVYNNITVNFQATFYNLQNSFGVTNVTEINDNTWGGIDHWFSGDSQTWPALYYHPEISCWYEMPRYEDRSETNLLTLNADYSPPSTNHAIGTNLTTLYLLYGVSNPVDFTGASRPASGIWTRGALELNAAVNSMVFMTPFYIRD